MTTPPNTMTNDELEAGLLSRLDIMAEGGTPLARTLPYDIGDYWNICEEAAQVIRQLMARVSKLEEE